MESQRIELAEGSVAWGPCYIGEGTKIKSKVSIGCLAHIGRDVQIGANTRIQGGVYVADNTQIGKDCFIGPNATILNDRYPPSGDPRKWEPVKIENGAIIGGGATVLPGINVGQNAVVAAGAVLTKNIPSGEVWVGNPARYHMSRKEYEEARV
tara:strand:- start:24 stop:482 length:459 start_codon:yes stop_codon:yes gene_type:complete